MLRNFCAGVTLLATTLAVFSPLSAAGQSDKVLYRFLATSSDGYYPTSLVRGKDGNFYGATDRGGAFDQGTVFQLVPKGSGLWTENILYNFTGGADGAQPSTGLLFDNAGNLYGATFTGGTQSASEGVIYELSPPSSSGGSWTETVLFDFNTANTAIGFNPAGNLAWDAAGNFYGTTNNGGAGNASICGDLGCGVVFQMTPPSAAVGAWTYHDIHDFLSAFYDGYGPTAVAVKANGIVFATTCCGGAGAGAVVSLTPPKAAGGTWKETLLHSFTGNNGQGDGWLPYGVTISKTGALFGTTALGGANSDGTVFELAPSTSGKGWAESILYSFTGGNDGAQPYAGVIVDANGNLYGTTTRAGSSPCPTNGSAGCGTVFRLSPAGGAWNETTLYDFTGGEDGFWPRTSLLLVNGTLYGTTQLGGTASGNGGGTAFAVKP